MKRENVQISGSVLPDIPFAENLVFYAPLTYGDLTDHISGTSPTTDTQCSCTWDSSKEMYLLSANGANNFRCALNYTNLSLQITEKSTQQFTVTGIFEWVSKNGNNFEAFYSVSNQKQSSNTCLRWTCGDVTKYDGGKHFTGIKRLTAIVDNSSGQGTYIRYEDNELVTNFGSWSNIKNPPNSVGICQLLINQYAFSCYAKDVRVYNRALSAAEVAQL